MRKETWEKIMGGIAVTILPDTRGGLLLQVKGPVSAEYRAQSAINKSVPADKLRGLKMPEIFVEAMLENMMRKLTDDIQEDADLLEERTGQEQEEGEENVPV